MQSGPIVGSQLDISQLTVGLYIIELTTAEGSMAMSKFMKE